MQTHYDPFGASGPAEVPLRQAPLVRVVAQLRFPPIVSVGKAEFVAPFQEALRRRYPILRPESGFVPILGPMMGLPPPSSGVVWRFHDKADGWRVSLSSDFVALDATAYEDREDFFQRFEEVLVALQELTQLSVYERLGVRYINRVRGAELEKLSAMVRPEVVGIAASSISGLGHTICESLFQTDDAGLNARWGRLPPNLTTDPISIEPIPEPSWILDLDMFRQRQKDFDTKSILEDGRSFARTIHDFFRWCVNDEFLKAYGGTP